MFSLQRAASEEVNWSPIVKTNKPSNLRDEYLARLHHGSKASTQEYARELRLRTTEAEKKLWYLLRNRQLKGKKFRRQHAIANYVVDFYCSECKLVIELDGNFHTDEAAKDYDKSRTALLTELGITVLRFWNEEVISDPERVLIRIGECL
jgi:very-short-patch-repair endonuclease